MRRRLELARGLLHKPAVLFLDEPTLGLDPQTRARTWDYIKKMAQKEQTTVVLTTHYMEEAEQVCDRVGIIDHGQIMALDAPDNLKESMGGDLVVIQGKRTAPAKNTNTALCKGSETKRRRGGDNHERCPSPPARTAFHNSACGMRGNKSADTQ